MKTPDYAAPGPILSSWMDYRLKVLPDGAGPVQIQETRKAFYAGAVAIWRAVNDVGEDAVTEAQGG